MEPKLFIATKAFIVFQGKVLILREASTYRDGSQTGRYVEVGGRVPPGQKFDESLRREIREETGLEVEIGRPFFVSEWRPVVRGEPWQIIGVFFECFAKSDEIRLSDEHDGYLWIDPKEYKNYDIADNLPPVFEAYLDRPKTSAP